MNWLWKNSNNKERQYGLANEKKLSTNISIFLDIAVAWMKEARLCWGFLFLYSTIIKKKKGEEITAS